MERGHIILVHAAAGGTGSLLCQWANSLGGIVIGTVSTKEKAVEDKEVVATMSLSLKKKILPNVLLRSYQDIR